MKNQRGFSAVEGLLILVIVGLLGFVGWYTYHTRTSVKKTQQSTLRSSASATTNSGAVKTNTTEAKGTITGTPSYPSSSIPQDEKVCAVSIAEPSKIYCDAIGEKQTKPSCSPVADVGCEAPPLVKFSIKVPAGEYYVYAIAENKRPNYKAYYDEFSKCGNSVNCPEAGHKQYIKVTVVANTTIDNIDPGDWYAN